MDLWKICSRQCFHIFKEIMEYVMRCVGTTRKIYQMCENPSVDRYKRISVDIEMNTLISFDMSTLTSVVKNLTPTNLQVAVCPSLYIHPSLFPFHQLLFALSYHFLLTSYLFFLCIFELTGSS